MDTVLSSVMSVLLLSVKFIFAASVTASTLDVGGARTLNAKQSKTKYMHA